MNAAELFVRCLEAEGVEYVFGLPGEENAHFMLALEQSKQELRDAHQSELDAVTEKIGEYERAANDYRDELQSVRTEQAADYDIGDE